MSKRDLQSLRTEASRLQQALEAALHEARLADARAAALTGLARALSGADSTTAVVDVLAAALLDVLGCDAGAVWLWDSDAGELRAAATAGLSSELHDALLQMPVRPDDSPELGALLTTREPLVLTVGGVSPVLDAMLDALGLRAAIGVALSSGFTLLGAVTGSWIDGPPEAEVLSDTIKRLQGVADSAATALHNARLVEQARHQALHDALTGLPNRVLFHDRLDTAFRAAVRDGLSAVLFCDLDRFKAINDELGHAAGDEALRQVAQRLREAVRPGDTVARLGGDEFAVLLPGGHAADVATEVAQRIAACFHDPLHLAGRRVRVTVSIGVAVQGDPGDRGEVLLQSADTAMFAAKQRGRHEIATADSAGPHLERQADARLRRELWAAPAAGELRVLYQPLWAIGDGGTDLIGAEALLRWQHPRLGLLRPAAFLSLAEQDGSVIDLDMWVLREACKQAARWPTASGRRPLHVAVNLSARTLTDARLYDVLRLAVVDADLQPATLQVEIVESLALADVGNLVDRLTALRQLGVRVALDDFGTGYSTLSWLQELPVDRVKVDRAFIMDLTSDQPRRRRVATAVLRSIIRLGRELHIDVLAEGVETQQQLSAIRKAGCRLAQGHLLGKPTTSEELLARAATATR